MSCKKDLLTTWILPARDRNSFPQFKSLFLILLRYQFHIFERDAPKPIGIPRYLIIFSCLICFHSWEIQWWAGPLWTIRNYVLLCASLDLETTHTTLEYSLHSKYTCQNFVKITSYQISIMGINDNHVIRHRNSWDQLHIISTLK